MSAQMSNSLEIALWQALRLRVTTFLSADSVIDDTSIWNVVIGGVPDEEQRRPREGLLQQVGTLAGLAVVLRIVHPRIDWFLQPNIRKPDRFSGPPDWQVAPFSNALETLSQVVAQWFSMDLQVVRVAFGANLVQPANDLRDAHLKLKGYLADLRIDPENSFDVLYQINRPRESAVIQGLRINRLSKWSVATQATGELVVQLNPSAEEQVSFISERPVVQRYASSLELDINTVATYERGLPQSQLNNLFDELMDWGKEIAERGDVP